MKRLMLFSMLITLATFNLLAQESVSCKQFSKQYKRAYEKSLKSKQSPRKFDVSYYRLVLKVNPEIKYISGVVTSYFTTEDSVDILFFDMSDQLQVDSVVYRGNNIGSHRQQNNEVEITLPITLGKNVVDSVSIHYSGVPVSDGFGSFVQDSYNDQDSIIWTLSEPFGAMEWWPCQNNLYDKADSIELQITTPLRYKVASNGLLTKIDTIASEATYYWKSNYSIATYLVGFAVTNYKVVEDIIVLNNDTLLLQHFLYPNDTVSEINSLVDLPVFMNYFDSLLGTYPFIKEKYGHASFTFGGGMEHQSMSFMGNYGGELMAHELAHQWFGNKITCGSWQDIWLNEGFASYMVLLTYENNIIHSDFYYPIYLQNLREASFLHPNQSVYRKDTSAVDSIFNHLSYEKGAAVLHMMRWLIGDSAFFSGIRNYLNDTALVYGFAKTADLKRHFEKSSKMSLDAFFDDWIYGKGFPTYAIEWSQNNGQLDLKVNQTQSDPSVYFFDMALPIQLIGPQLDTIIRLNPRFSGDRFSIPISKFIDTLVFDPEMKVLGKSSIVSNLKKKFIKPAEIKIYPNPTNGILNVESKKMKIQSYKVYNLSGKLVHTAEFNQSINLQKLIPGNYIIEIIGERMVYRHKITLL